MNDGERQISSIHIDPLSTNRLIGRHEIRLPYVWKWPIPVLSTLVILTIFQISMEWIAEGRTWFGGKDEEMCWIAPCLKPKINSLCFIDQWSFTHFIHGALYFILCEYYYYSVHLPTTTRIHYERIIELTVMEVIFELFENTTYCIRYWRDSKFQEKSYSGDSMFNSLGDTVFCIVGYCALEWIFPYTPFQTRNNNEVCYHRPSWEQQHNTTATTTTTSKTATCNYTHPDHKRQGIIPQSELITKQQHHQQQHQVRMIHMCIFCVLWDLSCYIAFQMSSTGTAFTILYSFFIEDSV